MLKRCMVLLSMCSLFVGIERPRAEARPPDKIGKGCVNGQCHSQIGRKGRSIHRPAKFGHCNFCHKPTQPRRHRFVLERSPRLCLTCHRRHKSLHTRRKPRTQERIQTLAKWDCLSCHNPHQSPRRALLRKSPTSLCQSCHQSVHRPHAASSTPTKIEGSFHRPVKQGECLSCHRPHLPSPKARLMRRHTNSTCIGCHRKQVLSKKHMGWLQLHPKLASQCDRCHQPHASPHRKLLRQTGSAMCLQCHREVKKHLASDLSVHRPAKKDCLGCHTPHGSAHKGLLKASQTALCISCHKKVYRKDPAIRSSHHLNAQARGCLGCHQPHSSTHSKLKTLSEAKLCLSCHQEEIQTKSGRNIEGMKTYERKRLHQPLQKGRCLDCHKPHQSLHAWLLQGAFPKSVYAPYSKKQYGLCYSCHNSTLAERRSAKKGETRFRNGLLNLHFLHVNKKHRGRTCGACHASHGSSQHGLIRSSFPYGERAWNLPIKFRKHADGGGCVSGCHAAKDYRRTKPLQKGYLLHPPPYSGTSIRRKPSPKR